MLKRRILETGSAAFVAAYLTAMLFIFSSQQPCKRCQPQSYNNDKTQGQKIENETFSQKFFPDPISFYNFSLVLVTGGLIVIGIIQANAAKQSAEVARQSLVTVQRAFVFIDSFQVNIVNHDLIVAPKWRNSGTTPTRFMTNWVSWKPFTSEPSDDFVFPDLDEGGNPVDDKDKNPPLMFVGPNATMFASALTIPKPVLDHMRANQARIFVWGWTRYQDVFDANHVTKFCNEIKILGTWSEGEKAFGAFSFPLYRRHNCTDDECDGEK